MDLDPSKITARELIIRTLCEKDYSIKDIKIIFKNEYNKAISYQAVYKILEQLKEKSLVIKTDKIFCINSIWAENMHEFFSNTHSRCFTDKTLQNVDKEILTLTFNSIYELDKYNIKIHNYFYTKINSKDIICLHYKHHWWHLLYPQKDFEIKESNSKFYCVCSRDSSLDRLGSEFKRKVGMNVVYSSKFNDTVKIYGDFVITVFKNNKINRLLDDFFDNVKNLEELDIKEFIKILKMRNKILVVIEKNREKAELIRRNTLELFNQQVMEEVIR